MVNYCQALFSIPSEIKNKIAIIDVTQNESLSYADLQNRVLKTAFWLNSKGLRKDNVLTIHMPNGIPTLIVHMAAQFIGVTSCLLDPLVREKQLPYHLSVTGSTCLISHLNKEIVEPVLESDCLLLSELDFKDSWASTELISVSDMVDWDADKTCYIYFTSGTTSLPKSVPLTSKNHENFFKITDKYWQPVDESSKHLCFVPFSHGFGSVFLIPLAIRTHAQLIIVRSFHPATVLESMKKYGATHLYGVPSHYQQLLKMPDCKSYLSSLKMAFCAAAKLDKEVITQWKDVTGIQLEEGYGLIETTGGIVWRVGIQAQNTGHMGEVPSKDLIEIGILSENNELLKNEELGEIAVRGKSVTKGYLNNPEENSRVFVDGWFKTGDAGYISKDNHLFMTGRIKDIINIAGIKISPFEVESVLNEHPYVQESVVVSFEDTVYGEVVKAFVKITNKTLTERDLIRYASQHLISYQVPKRIEFVNEYPLNSMGKVDRKKLRTTEWKS